MKKTILIIEDDELQREMLREFLSQYHFDLLFAKDGLEGLELIKTEAYDLIIADIRLPYVSGIGLIKYSRQTQGHVPIICVTGYGEYPKRIAKEESADVIMEKPYDLKELKGHIERLLEGR